MEQVKISVVIPTYHRNDLLAKCLNCLAPGVQTLPAEKYEVIVTDDGFKTTAEEMIRNRYSWVKWLAGPRKGAAANRNNGAKYAKGSFIAFTDDDCLPSSSWLSSFYSALTPHIQVYEGKTTCETGVCSPMEEAPVNLTGGYLWSCNMLVKARLFQEISGFDEKFPYPYMEDVDFRERIKKAGLTFLFIQDAIVDHPPRRRLWGDKLGASQESLVYYWRCKKKKKFFKVQLIRNILSYRIRAILNFGFSLDSLKAVTSMIVEISYIISHMNQWQKKYPLE
ncbi:MAG TPA: glycosyltransferase [Coleofasciculaceae cyanobacterium]|jgi:GT2 family glycosyltransferase